MYFQTKNGTWHIEHAELTALRLSTFTSGMCGIRPALRDVSGKSTPLPRAEEAPAGASVCKQCVTNNAT
jgi:hypothetical protein